MALFPHLLQPVLWERTGNIPPLVRLLQAYLEKGAAAIANTASDKIVSRPVAIMQMTSFQIIPILIIIIFSSQPGLLGVFQKLIASKANDHQGFYLLNSIVEHMPV